MKDRSIAALLASALALSVAAASAQRLPVETSSPVSAGTSCTRAPGGATVSAARSMASSDGVFELSARWAGVAHRTAAGGRFEMESTIEASAADPCDCVCPLLFSDGFESGDTSQWSSTQS